MFFVTLTKVIKKANFVKNQLIKDSSKKEENLNTKLFFTQNLHSSQSPQHTFVLPNAHNNQSEFYVFLSVTNTTQKNINFSRFGTFKVSKLIESNKIIEAFITDTIFSLSRSLTLDSVEEIKAGETKNIFLTRVIISFNNENFTLITESVAGNTQYFDNLKPGNYSIQFLYENHNDLVLYEPEESSSLRINPARNPGKLSSEIVAFKETWKGSFVTDPIVFELVNQ